MLIRNRLECKWLAEINSPWMLGWLAGWLAGVGDRRPTSTVPSAHVFSTCTLCSLAWYLVPGTWGSYSLGLPLCHFLSDRGLRILRIPTGGSHFSDISSLKIKQPSYFILLLILSYLLKYQNKENLINNKK